MPDTQVDYILRRLESELKIARECHQRALKNFNCAESPDWHDTSNHLSYYDGVVSTLNDVITIINSVDASADKTLSHP